MIVRERPPFSDDANGIRIRIRPQRVDLPVFNLETGEVTDRRI